MVVDYDDLAGLRHHVTIHVLLADQAVVIPVDRRESAECDEARWTDEIPRGAIDIVHEFQRYRPVGACGFASANVPIGIDVNGRDAWIERDGIRRGDEAE